MSLLLPLPLVLLLLLNERRASQAAPVWSLILAIAGCLTIPDPCPSELRVDSSSLEEEFDAAWGDRSQISTAWR